MTRSQDGALLLSCAALSSATQCRFIPALSLMTLSALTSTLPDWGNDKSKGAGFTLGPLLLDGISKATDNMIRELILTEA